MPRFFVDRVEPGTILLPEHEARHATQSLRLRAGDQVELIDGQGRIGQGLLRIAPCADRRKQRAVAAVQVELHVVRQVEPPTAQLRLIVAACKGERLAWMVEKCTELGATALCFAAFERSVVRIGAGALDKLRRTAIEACKQCGRAWLPELSAAETLPAALAGTIAADGLFIAEPDRRATSFAGALRSLPPAAGLRIVIGPEGGLSPAELAQLKAHGGRLVRLGPHVLRVETAAVAAVAAWAAGMDGPA